MLIAIVPLIAVVVGILVYVLASNTKLSELGRLTYFAGLLVTLLVTARHVVRLL